MSNRRKNRTAAAQEEQCDAGGMQAEIEDLRQLLRQLLRHALERAQNLPDGDAAPGDALRGPDGAGDEPAADAGPLRELLQLLYVLDSLSRSAARLGRLLVSQRALGEQNALGSEILQAMERAIRRLEQGEGGEHGPH